MNSYLIHSFSPDWFMHQIVSAIIHSAIYGMAYHAFKGLSTGGAMLAGAAMLLVAFVIYKAFSK
jgi:hypothetical protein